MYANITNPANFQLQDFAQFGFRVITTDFIPVPGEQYRTLYVLQDAVVTATTQKGDDITSKAILAGTLLHGLFNSVSITSGRVLAYAAGRVTADEIIALYEAYVVALGGTLENTQCAIDTLNDTGVDFFADASLVMIPEGYATGVVYGQRPLTSDSQLTFTRASTATRVGPDGAIAVVGSNVPRIDYTGGGCGKLLLEPQRTNLALYSEQFDNAGWTKLNATISANAATSPDGTQNADKLVESATSAIHYCETSVSVISGQSYSYSVYAKQGERHITLQGSAPTNSAYATFNLSTGVVGASAVGSASIIDAGNGWYRCTLTFTSAATSVANMAVLLADSPTAGRSSSYSGNGTSGVFLWGAQLEAGAYATSYIPTTAAAVTRLADACSKTGISSLIGQTQGTLFLDFEKTNNDNTGLGGYFRLDVNDGTISNRILFGFDLNQVNATVIVSAPQATISTTGVQTQKRIKAAFAYKANDFVMYVNGVQIGTDTSGSVPSGMANFQFGVNQTTPTQTSGVVNQQLFFKTRLTNEQLQTLTSL
jgi:hypothetical protein